MQAFVSTALRRDLAALGTAARQAVLHLHPLTVAEDFAGLLAGLSQRREAA